LAVKTASEMTYIVSSGALNSTPTNNPAPGVIIRTAVVFVGAVVAVQVPVAAPGRPDAAAVRALYLVVVTSARRSRRYTANTPPFSFRPTSL